MADGAITIDTSIDTKGIQKGVKSIAQSLERISVILTRIGDHIGAGITEAGLSMTSSVTSVVNDISSAEKAAEKSLDDAEEAWRRKTEQDMKDLTISRGDEGADSDYDGPLEQPVEIDANSYKASAGAMAAIDQSAGNVLGKTPTLLSQVTEAKKKLKDLAAQGVGPSDEEYDRQATELAKLTAEYTQYTHAVSASGLEAITDFETLEGKMAAARAEISRLKYTGFGIESEEMQDQIRYLAEMQERYKALYTEASKTDAMREKEAAAASAKAEKEAAAQRKNEARVAAVNEKMEKLRAKEVQAAVESKRLQEIGQNAKVSQKNIVALNEELARLKVRQADLKKAGLSTGYEEFDQNASRISQINAQLKSYQGALTGTASSTRKNVSLFTSLRSKLSSVYKTMANVFKAAHANAKKIEKSSEKAGLSMKGMLKTMHKYGLGIRSLFVLVNKVRSAVMEGLQTLVKYDAQTNASMSSVTSALTRLKNSLASAFAPILNFVAPALTTLINLLSEAATKVGMFFAALTGQSTYTKATEVQQDYAASLDSATTATEENAKATKKAKRDIAGWDELTVISQSDTGTDTTTGASTTTPQMFETVPVTEDMVDLSKKLKSIFKDIFEPFRKAWKKQGKATIEAAKNALTGLGKLAKSVGKSLMEVWTNGTGEKMVTTILQIAQDILNVIGNIATRLSEAWNRNKVGTAIVQGLANIFQDILDFIHTITTATEEWSRSIDFYPLLDSIKNMINNDIEPAVQKVLSLLSDLYTTIVLPMLTWVIETALPMVNEIIGDIAGIVGTLAQKFQEAWDKNETGKKIVEDVQEILETILSVIDDLVESTKKWVENLNLEPLLTAIEGLLENMKPVIKTIGDVFKDIYEDVIQPALKWIIETGLPWILDKLGELAEWIGEHKETVETFGKVLIAAFAAETIGGLATTIIGHILNLVSNVKTLKTLLGENGLLGTIGKIISASTEKGGLTTVLESLSKAAGGASTAASTSTATAGGLSTVASVLGTAGVVTAATVGTLELARGIAKMTDAAQDGNGDISQLGAELHDFVQHLGSASQLTQEQVEALDKLVEEYETGGVSMEDAVAGITQKLDEYGVSSATANGAIDTLSGKMALTSQTADLMRESFESLSESTKVAAGDVDLSALTMEEGYEGIRSVLLEMNASGDSLQGTFFALDNVLSEVSGSGSASAQSLYTAILNAMEQSGISTDEFKNKVAELPGATIAAAESVETNMQQIDDGVTRHMANVVTQSQQAFIDGMAEKAEEGTKAAKEAVETNTAAMDTTAEANLSSVEETAKQSLDSINTETVTKWGSSTEEVQKNLNAMKLAASQKLAEMTNTVRSYATSQYNLLVNKWKYISSAISSIMSTMCSNVRTMLNNMITTINNGIRNINGAISQIESSFNFSLSVPTATGTQTVSSSASFARVSSVPYLATGAVIPPNQKFMAVLGDQKSGNNIEAPESLIRKIVREEAGQGSGNGQQVIELSIDGQKLMRWIVEQANQYTDRTGKTIFEG